ncbi:hypothetical protein CDL15_Pgr004650 [Punica granatum]|uniref:Retrotransposon gag domain-containing protein n=1 Tax=Punica granatum TaxID=22663 RepID=A0A218WPA2_PUNGR|nr:hypothetical protein CDL15_Pgr004650 [Punica granatum]PKI63891.1 hypothetical protein CRG98_015727 [Punica granatum]
MTFGIPPLGDSGSSSEDEEDPDRENLSRQVTKATRATGNRGATRASGSRKATRATATTLFTAEDVERMVQEQVEHLLQAVERKHKGLSTLNKNNDSPFTLEVREATIPRKLDVPNITQFDGKADFVEHVTNQTTSLLGRNATYECLFFPATLKGITNTWFHHSLPEVYKISIS